MSIVIHNGDSQDVLKTYPDNYFDSVVTDAHWGIKFMGLKWDYDIPSVELWKEVLRVMKPGAHILCACGTRTQHRMAVNIEDAGFEIRDIITHHYASGFPKSMDISKQIDKQSGAKREVIGSNGSMPIQTGGRRNTTDSATGSFERIDNKTTAPTTEEAKKWNGWGTALKPATELWTLARKPISENTIAENVVKYGTGGINIDACRIPVSNEDVEVSKKKASKQNCEYSQKENIIYGKYETNNAKEISTKGRFPANVIFDDLMGAVLDEQSGERKGFVSNGNAEIGEHSKGVVKPMCRGVGISRNDSGGASRFFYCAKPSKAERDKGLIGLDFKKNIGHNRFDKCTNCGGLILQNPNRPSACKCNNPKRENDIVEGNFHPTVKPLKLIKYFVKLLTPPGGTVLDPFNGSGTTGVVCKIEGFGYAGIDKEKDYCDITVARIKAWDVNKPEDEQLELLFDNYE